MKITRAVGFVLCCCATHVAGAQVPSGSAAAVGMAQNFSLMARGYQAIAWNPAMLGASGRPSWSTSLMALNSVHGLNPLTLSDLKQYENVLVPEGTKRVWLDRIVASGGFSGMAGADMNWLALQIGPVAAQVSSSAGMRANVSPGIAELVMFGNVEADGTPIPLDLSGTEINLFAFTTMAGSMGLPVLRIGDVGRLTLGVTGKYVLGHFTAWVDESSGAATVDPLGVRLMMSLIHTMPDGSPIGGSGYGIDVASMYETPVWAATLVLRNVVNTFAWNDSLLMHRSFNIRLDEEEHSTELHEGPFVDAPDAIRNSLERQPFGPQVAGAVAYQAHRRVRFTGEVRAGRRQTGVMLPQTHVGAGAEWRPVSMLRLQTGAAVISFGEGARGVQAGAGVGLHLGPLSLTAALASRRTPLGIDTILTFGGLSLLR